tara:strand:+ start:347 stop:574 length:228 start_codon:yes stop_codon:yes gene_type:complete
MKTPINDGGPAFPVTGCVHPNGNAIVGMSLRDYFAGQALAGILASANFGSTKDWIGGKAYEAADSMLAARKEDAK